MKKRTTIKTSNFIIICVVLLFCAAIIKLCYVVLNTTTDGVNLKEMSASITTAKKTLYASRGSIYDVNGDLLASTVNSYTLIAYLSPTRTTDITKPKHVVDKAYTAKMLATVLPIAEETIYNYLNVEGKYQVEFGTKGKNLSELDKKKIEALELPGIDFITSTKRYYDMSTFASYIIGYAKKNEDNEIKGELGIESYFNDILAGTNGYTEYQKYTSGNYQIPNTPSKTEKAKDGSDIYLTIDSNIQLIAEKAVKKYSDYNIDWAVFTVMDAETGAIVASATNPNFDPNDTNTITSYLNPLVSYQYEPGSVMKVFSFASSIEEGLYNGDKTYNSGSIVVADATIRDAERGGWGTITFDTGFAYSSNVAATILALDLGAGKLSDYYQKLGFGRKTGIELSNEAVGDIGIKYQTELANASFGQGVSVTPVQILQAMSTMTNDGNMIKPYIVDKIVDSEGNVSYEGKRTVVGNVFSSKTVEKMHSLMHKVVYEGLTKMWQVPNVNVMGKTGTAQIASSKGGYISGEYENIKSFAGIFPEENPKYIVYVAAKRVHSKPRNFAEPITTAIEEIANYAKLTQKDNKENTQKLITIDNYISKELSSSVTLLKNKDINIITIGDGKYIINQYPLKDNYVLKNEKLFLLTNGNNIIIPDMQGWSKSEVNTYCKLANINCLFEGYGYVISQSLPANSVYNPGTVFQFQLNVK